jgi:flavin-dependent dehydrogenase
MSPDQFDTIVVGARCAGAPLATLLARAGQKVLLLDADKLPSDQPLSTHYLQPLGVDWLDELGVGARVRSLSPPTRIGQLEVLGARVPITYQRGRAAHCIRRSVLDALLQENAVSAGVDLRDESEVVGLLRDADRVSGVEVKSNGTTQRYRATVVVGADGRNSTVAKLAGAKEYLGYDNVRFGYWGYWPAPAAWTHDAELRGIDAHIGFSRDKSIRFVFQCDGDLLLLGVTPPIAELDAWRGNHEAAYVSALRATPVTAKLIENNQREGKLIGIKKARFFFREAAGPGFALVGDAGLHKDPTPGIGITDALRDARNLARAILEGGDRPLVRYHRQRDVDSIELFHFAKQMGDPAYINPLNHLVYQRAGKRADIMARMAASADREISPFDVLSTSSVISWTLGAALRGRLSVLPPFLASGKENAQVQAMRRERIALRDAT